ncbi:hypothetical protein GCM10007352_18860 [Mucilaginibacter phyllosphaerae]|nr:hypothetical protein GCM10007352_18860 [Mucilaginibacter phyllosphaerae]
MKDLISNTNGRVTLPKTTKQCKLYQQLQAFSKDLDRLPDAREVSRNKPRSAPADLLPMVF